MSYYSHWGFWRRYFILKQLIEKLQIGFMHSNTAKIQFHVTLTYNQSQKYSHQHLTQKKNKNKIFAKKNGKMSYYSHWGFWRRYFIFKQLIEKLQIGFMHSNTATIQFNVTLIYNQSQKYSHQHLTQKKNKNKIFAKKNGKMSYYSHWGFWRRYFILKQLIEKLQIGFMHSNTAKSEFNVTLIYNQSQNYSHQHLTQKKNKNKIFAKKKWKNVVLFPLGILATMLYLEAADRKIIDWFHAFQHCQNLVSCHPNL